MVDEVEGEFGKLVWKRSLFLSGAASGADVTHFNLIIQKFPKVS